MSRKEDDYDDPWAGTKASAWSLILGDEKRMKLLMAYINDTKRFEDSHDNLQHAEQDDEAD